MTVPTSDHGRFPKVTIRDAVPVDAPALAALERVSPDSGPLAVEIEIKDDYFALAARYPGVRGYVAMAPPSSAVVGMLFASIAPTQINGDLAPGAYLFALRVHPAYRRQGVASSLIAHACERARVEQNARVIWAAVASRNEPSLRTFRRAGFHQERALGVRIAAPGLLPHRRPASITCRPAMPDDLPYAAEALNAGYANHQFWRPLTAERLAVELATVHHSPADVTTGLVPDGNPVGVASAFVPGRVARLRFLGLRVLPNPLNKLLSLFLRPVPLRLLLVRYASLPADQPQAVTDLLRCLHRRHLSEAWVLALVRDPLEPVWTAVFRLPGLNASVCLLVRSEQPIEAARPWCLT
ncbi:MAG: GNAT family N-acetyltransferase [Chloroflexi bacterium]|nr:GNAT family N-acetyltransferase [Chloroflexota bacterium]